jgi:hypothetical protein
METRRLLARIAEVLAADADPLDELPEGPRDRLRRREDMSYFNPSPAEILAATLLIQTEWSDHERMVRAGCLAPRHWHVPRVRVLGPGEARE